MIQLSLENVNRMFKMAFLYPIQINKAFQLAINTSIAS